MAAFTFAHIKFFGSSMLLSYLTLGLLFPAATAILPLFIKVRDLGLLDTYFGVVLPQVAFGLAMSILLLRRFFKDLPHELLEAALVDGCSYIKFFRYVTLPLSRPILATVGTIAFVNSWNAYLLPLVMLNTRRALSLAARHHGLPGRIFVRMAPDPRLHHADHPADHHHVPAGAEAHRRRPHRGRGQGLNGATTSKDGAECNAKSRHRNHRLRQHQHRLSQGGAALSHPRHQGGRRHAQRRRRSGAAPSSACPACASTSC